MVEPPVVDGPVKCGELRDLMLLVGKDARGIYRAVGVPAGLRNVRTVGEVSARPT